MIFIRQSFKLMAPMLGLSALLAVPTEAGAHISVDGSDSDAQARLQTLRENVKKAMLELYMENAEEHMDDRMSSVTGHTTAGTKAAVVAQAAAQPFGQLEAFGREDTAAELTDASIGESNRMIDQIERAVVSETKRSMFRALTRLRGATIASYDGMANAQAANVDNYARKKQWSKTHQLNHLANQEGNVESWAFPNRPKQEEADSPAASPASAPAASPAETEA